MCGNRSCRLALGMDGEGDRVGKSLGALGPEWRHQLQAQSGLAGLAVVLLQVWRSLAGMENGEAAD